MTRLTLIGLAAALVSCASAPKKPVVVEQKVDPEVQALEPFLASLEADEEAAEEEGREARRRLLTGRMLLAGKSIDEVLSAAALQGEPALVRAVLAARKGDFQGALTAARTAGGAQGVQLALSILLAAGELDAAKQVVAQAAEDEGAAVLNAWMMHRDGKSKEAIEALRKHLFNKGRDLFAYITLARIHAEQGELRLLDNIDHAVQAPVAGSFRNHQRFIVQYLYETGCIAAGADIRGAVAGVRGEAEKGRLPDVFLQRLREPVSALCHDQLMRRL